MPVMGLCTYRFNVFNVAGRKDNITYGRFVALMIFCSLFHNDL